MTRKISKVVPMSLAALGLLAAGCDIFPAQPGGTPQVVRVMAVDQFALSTPPEQATANASGTYVLGEPAISGGVDASNINAAGPNGHTSRFQIIDVQFNKVLDGASIQKAVDDCTPFDAAALTVTTTPAQPGGAACGDPNQSQPSCFTNWFACYVPQTGDPTVNSQIFVFQLSGAAYDPTSSPSGQGAGLLPGFTYAVTGAAKDLSGTSVSFKSSVTTQTAPMITAATTTSIDISWSCTADVASVDIQRAPDSDGTGVAPGTFADLAGATGIACTAGAVQTHTDATGAGTQGTPYWYQLVLHPTTGTTTATSGVTNGTTLPDPANVSALTPTTGQVVVDWTIPVTGADTFKVQRSTDSFATVVTTVKSGIKNNVATYTDTKVTAGTVYQYRVVSVAAVGVVNETGTTMTVTAQ